MFNKIKDYVAENFEVAQGVTFADIVQRAQLTAPNSQLPSQYTDYINKLIINVKETTLHRFDWQDLINGNC